RAAFPTTPLEPFLYPPFQSSGREPSGILAGKRERAKTRNPNESIRNPGNQEEALPDLLVSWIPYRTAVSLSRFRSFAFPCEITESCRRVQPRLSHTPPSTRREAPVM